MQHGNASDEMDASADASADSGADAVDLAAEYERGENVASIEGAPRHILLDGAARAHLVQLARAGLDVQIYQAASLNGSGVWNVWLVDRRVPLADYVARYEGHEIAAQLADAHAGADADTGQDANTGARGGQGSAAPALFARQRELQTRAAAGGSICQDDYEWATGTGVYAADAAAPDTSDTSDTTHGTPDERGR